jgi:hypothetical protein
MLVKDIIGAVKIKQKNNNFQIKIYEKNDSSYAVNLTASSMISEILNRQIKSFCIENDDRTMLIKQIIIILE